ncbi:MAG: arsenate reductase ArsC [Bacteroidota bacterium]
MAQRILILCTGNSCRSQIAEGFLKSFNSNLEVYSAGTNPASHVSSRAIQVMKEVGIDISREDPKSVDQFLNDSFDYVITVCDHAKETCPIFTGKVLNRIHIGFDDPAEATGTEEEVITVFRRVRDEIKEQFYEFYQSKLKDSRG